MQFVAAQLATTHYPGKLTACIAFKITSGPEA
jgi:hypothetical protein